MADNISSRDRGNDGENKEDIGSLNNSSKGKAPSSKKSSVTATKSVNTVLTVKNCQNLGIDDERYKKLVKEEQNSKPENCEGLIAVKTNAMV
ncbi:hypothetical protein ACF0H5_009618 [Mactra antiquata]